MSKLTVAALTTWMSDTCVDSVEEYRLAQGTKSMSDCLHVENGDYELLAFVSDRLQWDCFLDDRISTLWLQILKPGLLESHLYLSPRKWGKHFIDKLLPTTHKQWVFRNNGKHYKVDGLTQADHDRIFLRVEELMYTNPDELLPRHKHLLEEDFEALMRSQLQTCSSGLPG